MSIEELLELGKALFDELTVNAKLEQHDEVVTARISLELRSRAERLVFGRISDPETGKICLEDGSIISVNVLASCKWMNGGRALLLAFRQDEGAGSLVFPRLSPKGSGVLRLPPNEFCGLLVPFLSSGRAPVSQADQGVANLLETAPVTRFLPLFSRQFFLSESDSLSRGKTEGVLAEFLKLRVEKIFGPFELSSVRRGLGVAPGAVIEPLRELVTRRLESTFVVRDRGGGGYITRVRFAGRLEGERHDRPVFLPANVPQFLFTVPIGGQWPDPEAVAKQLRRSSRMQLVNGNPRVIDSMNIGGPDLDLASAAEREFLTGSGGPSDRIRAVRSLDLYAGNTGARAAARNCTEEVAECLREKCFPHNWRDKMFSVAIYSRVLRPCEGDELVLAGISDTDPINSFFYVPSIDSPAVGVTRSFSGFYLRRIVDFGELGEPVPRSQFRLEGMVLPESFLTRHLDILGNGRDERSNSIFYRSVLALVSQDLAKRRGNRKWPESLTLHSSRHSRIYDFNNGRSIHLITCHHDYGEHLVFLSRRLTSGLVYFRDIAVYDYIPPE